MTKIYESREDLERERLERKLHHAEKAQRTGAAVAAFSWGAFELATMAPVEGKPAFIIGCSLAGIGALAGGYALANYVEANKLKDKLATLTPEKVVITPAAQAPAPQVSSIAYDEKLQNNLSAAVAH